MKFQEMDRHVTYAEQIGSHDGPIKLVNLFTMDTDDVEGFLRVWSEDAAFMKRQPGYIRAQLHRGTAGSATFINIATWESAEALRVAFTAPEFQQTLTNYPESVEASPHVFVEVAVPGICTA
ncbi:MAG TPA: antibiotic biosynthesis monooxygenase family protein [Pseudonocardia sp.]